MKTLFDTTRIRGMELKNRFVRSATHEGMSDGDGNPTPKLLNLYERLAEGGVGLIITGFASVSKDGKCMFRGMQGIDRDSHIPKYRELVDRVHGAGAKIAMQIAHCGRQTHRDVIGVQPIAPSRVLDTSTLVMPREMTEEDIERVIEAFARAAWRVRESGFDAVELHGAHGYLISGFLCPHTNRRKDRWGGSLENRMRFVAEIYRRCRRAVGDDYPILIKISATDSMRKGLTIEESAVMARMMSDMGFDGIEVSCGIGEDRFTMLRGDLPVEAILQTWDVFRNKNVLYRLTMKHFGRTIVRPLAFTEAYNREAARIIKQSVRVPVFLVGGLTKPETMEDVVSSGDADYISLCRALIADPKLPESIRSGVREPSRCIHCNLCLGYLATRPVACYHGKLLS